MREASRPLFCAWCSLFAALTGWARIRGGYDDRFQGGMLGLSLGW